jgi:beta-N-acetylhexosaminidase
MSTTIILSSFTGCTTMPNTPPAAPTDTPVNTHYPIPDPSSPISNLIGQMTLEQKFGLLTKDEGRTTQVAVGTAEIKAISRDIAAQSITLLRDDAHLLPLPADAKLLVVETANGIGLGKALGATTTTTNAQPNASDINAVLGMAKDGRTAIVATTDAGKHRQQANLVNALLKAKIPTIVVAVRGPYDLLYLEAAPTNLASYGSNPPSIEALAAVLTGKVKPRGRLPVELPGCTK